MIKEDGWIADAGNWEPAFVKRAGTVRESEAPSQPPGPWPWEAVYAFFPLGLCALTLNQSHPRLLQSSMLPKLSSQHMPMLKFRTRTRLDSRHATPSILNQHTAASAIAYQSSHSSVFFDFCGAAAAPLLFPMPIALVPMELLSCFLWSARVEKSSQKSFRDSSSGASRR